MDLNYLKKTSQKKKEVFRSAAEKGKEPNPYDQENLSASSDSMDGYSPSGMIGS